MANTARSQHRYSGIDELEQVLIHFISEKDRSPSALVIIQQSAGNDQKTIDVWESIFIASAKC